MNSEVELLQKKLDELKQKLSDFEFLFDSADIPTLITESDGTYLNYNQAYVELMGHKEHDDLNKFHPANVSPAYQPDGRESFEKANEMIQTAITHGSHRFEWAHLRPDGKEFLSDVTLDIVRFNQKDAVRAVIRDISEKTKLERMVNEKTKELHELNEMFRMVLNSIPVRVFWKDTSLNYLGCNTNFANDAGLSTPSDLIGKDDYAMGWSEQAELYRQDDREIIEKDIAKINYEEPQTTPSGDKIWLRTSKIPLKTSSGKIFGVLGTYEDITEKKAIEDKLLEAKLQAEHASMAKSRFLANMSHELRTPMHAIMSFSSLAIQRTDDEKIQRYLENIHTSGERLTRLLDDLLDLSKLESGKLIAEFSEYDLTDIVYKVIDEIGILVQKNNVSLDFSCNTPHVIHLDKKLITQVIVNLISNAIKFSRENGDIQISISGNEDQFIVFSVVDEGIGIPEDELKDIFNSFVQSSHTTSNAGGTGLGLAISKEIIELHNGRIWAESPPAGKEIGSAFYFQLPVKQHV